MSSSPVGRESGSTTSSQNIDVEPDSSGGTAKHEEGRWPPAVPVDPHADMTALKSGIVGLPTLHINTAELPASHYRINDAAPETEGSMEVSDANEESYYSCNNRSDTTQSPHSCVRRIVGRGKETSGTGSGSRGTEAMRFFDDSEEKKPRTGAMTQECSHASHDDVHARGDEEPVCAAGSTRSDVDPSALHSSTCSDGSVARPLTRDPTRVLRPASLEQKRKASSAMRRSTTSGRRGTGRLSPNSPSHNTFSGSSHSQTLVDRDETHGIHSTNNNNSTTCSSSEATVCPNDDGSDVDLVGSMTQARYEEKRGGSSSHSSSSYSRAHIGEGGGGSVASSSGGEDSISAPSSVHCIPLPLPPPTAAGVHTREYNRWVRRNAVCTLAVDLETEDRHEEHVNRIQKSFEDREKLRDLLLQNPLFSFLDEDALDAAVDVMEVEHHSAGDTIFKEGEEPTSKLYVVLSGCCDVRRKGKSLRVVYPGGYVGELELMYQQKSSVASVICTEDTTFYTLRREPYQRLMLRRCLEQRSRFRKYIETVPFLKNVREYDKLRISDALTMRSYTAGESIMVYGQSCQELFFLMEGKTRVVGRTTDNVPYEIVVQEPGAVIGELEFLFDHSSIADVIVISSEAKVARISKSHFEAIMGPISECLMEFIAEVPIYDNYITTYASRTVHEELLKLRERAKMLKARKRRKRAASAAAMRSLAISSATVAPSGSLEEGVTEPTEDVDYYSSSQSGLRISSSGLPQVASLDGARSQASGYFEERRIQDFVSGLAEEGEVLMRLPAAMLAPPNRGGGMDASTSHIWESPLLPSYSENPVGIKTESLRASHPSGVFNSQTSPNDALVASATTVVPTSSVPFLHFPVKEVLDINHLSAIAIRSDGLVLSWSELLERLTGYSKSEAVGQSVYAFLQSEREQTLLQEVMEKMLEEHRGRRSGAGLEGGGAVRQESQMYSSQIFAQQQLNSGRSKSALASAACIYHFSCQDGLSSVAVDIAVVTPAVENVVFSYDHQAYSVVILAIRERNTNQSDPLMEQSMMGAEALMLQARRTLADGTLNYEQRLYAIADIIESFDTIQRAKEVSKEGWRPINLRQLVGKVIMECINECMDYNHVIHQRFENLHREDCCLDVSVMPRVLKHTLRIATRFTTNAEVTITVALREHSGMDFLAFIFSCDNAHLSPALSQLIADIQARRKTVATNTNDEDAVATSQPLAKSRPLQRGFTSELGLGESFAMDDSGVCGNNTPDNFLNTSDNLAETTTGGGTFNPNSLSNTNNNNNSSSSIGGGGSKQYLVDINLPRFRKHTRGIRHAVEQQGGTIRCYKDNEASHVMFLLPFIAPSQDDQRGTSAMGESMPNMLESSAVIPSPARLKSPRASSLQASPISFFSPQPNPSNWPESTSAPSHSALGNSMPRNSTPKDGDVDTPWLLFTAANTPSLQPASPNAPSASSLPPGSIGAPHHVNESGAVIATSGVPGNAMSLSSIGFTTLVAEENKAQQNLLCKYLWERKHAVLSASTFHEMQRLSESVDILVIDVMEFMLQSADTLNFLQEKAHCISIIVTGEMDEASREAYAATGFLVIPKPVRPAEFRAVMSKAEEKIAAIKRDAESITAIRRSLSGFRMAAWEKGELLGKGTHGEVYRATSLHTGDVMAVKEMRVGKNSDKLEEVLVEILAMCSLQHPNIIHYFSCELSHEAAMVSNPMPPTASGENSPKDAGSTAENNNNTNRVTKGKSRLLMAAEKKVHEEVQASNQYLRVFMEFAAGGALREYLAKNGKLSFKEFQSLMHDVVSGLAYIHANHYLHGDIKTANILLTKNKEGKIGDFGSARRLMPGEQLYTMEGSLTYMSPECLSAGELDDHGQRIGFSFPSDIWSLGVVAMEVITNTSPYSHVKAVTGPATLTQYLTTLTTETPDLSPLFDYPPCVTEFISACLQVNPLRRATAEQLLHFSIFHESSDEETVSALKALRQAELRHVLSQYVAFQEPRVISSPKVGAGGLRTFLQTKEDDSDDFFDSSTTEEEDEDENDGGEGEGEARYAEDDHTMERMMMEGRNERRDSFGVVNDKSSAEMANESNPHALVAVASYPSMNSDVIAGGMPNSSRVGGGLPKVDSMGQAGQHESDTSAVVRTPVIRGNSTATMNNSTFGRNSGSFSMLRHHGMLSGVSRTMGEDSQDTNSKWNMQPDQSTTSTIRGLSTREGVPNVKDVFSRTRGKMRPSKLSSIIGSVSSAMEVAADELLTSLTKKGKPSFPGSSKDLCMELSGDIIINNNNNNSNNHGPMIQSRHQRRGSLVVSSECDRSNAVPTDSNPMPQALTMESLTNHQTSQQQQQQSSSFIPPLGGGSAPRNIPQLQQQTAVGSLIPPVISPATQSGKAAALTAQQQQRQQYNAVRLARYHGNKGKVGGGAGMSTASATPGFSQRIVSDDGGPVSFSSSYDDSSDPQGSGFTRPAAAGSGGGFRGGGYAATAGLPQSSSLSAVSPANMMMVASFDPTRTAISAPSAGSPSSPLLRQQSLLPGGPGTLEQSAAQIFRAHHRKVEKKKMAGVFVAPPPPPHGDGKQNERRGSSLGAEDCLSMSPTPADSGYEAAGNAQVSRSGFEDEDPSTSQHRNVRRGSGIDKDMRSIAPIVEDIHGMLQQLQQQGSFTSAASTFSEARVGAPSLHPPGRPPLTGQHPSQSPMLSPRSASSSTLLHGLNLEGSHTMEAAAAVVSVLSGIHSALKTVVHGAVEASESAPNPASSKRRGSSVSMNDSTEDCCK